MWWFGESEPGFLGRTEPITNLGLAYEAHLLGLVVLAAIRQSAYSGSWWWGMMGIILRTSMITWFITFVACSAWNVIVWEIYDVSTHSQCISASVSQIIQTVAHSDSYRRTVSFVSTASDVYSHLHLRLYYTAATVGGCRILLHIQSALRPSLLPEHRTSITDSTSPQQATRGTVGLWKKADCSTNLTEATSDDFELGLYHSFKVSVSSKPTRPPIFRPEVSRGDQP